MTTTAPEDRPFPIFPRGKVREEALETFRVYLRQAYDADGLPFEESDIQAATRELSRYWSEADALDLYGLSVQQRALFLADQAHPLTASDQWLTNYHGQLWPVGPPLGASAGGGPIEWEATVGTVFVGSTTIPDPAAHTVKIGAFTYQVLYTEITPASGVAELVVKCLDTGFDTNAPAGSKAVGSYQPAGAKTEGVTLPDDFSGGAPTESAQQYARRILDEIRYRGAAGNNAQIRAWTRKSSNAIEDAFVYACALNAGTVVLCVVQRRGNGVGPLARQAGAGLLADATAYMVPPGSPVMPAHPFVVPLTFVAEPVDTMARLTMPKGSPAGWTDPAPWPNSTATVAEVTTVTSQTDIQITATGVNAPTGTPRVMIWDEASSSFELLAVTTVTDLGAGVYRLQLSAAPSFTVVIGDVVSPDAGVRVAIARGAELYHDSLGPGEVVDLETSFLAHRAFRFPPPDEAWPAQAGSSLGDYLRNALGGSSSNALVVSQSVTEPTVPASPADGPSLLTLGKFGVYPL